MPQSSFSPARVIGLILAVALAAFAIKIEGGRLSTFIQPASMILCWGVPLLLLFALSGRFFPVFLVSCAMACIGEPEQSNVRVANLAKVGKWLFVGVGVLSMFHGWILVLSNLSEPSVMGAGTAITLISIIYAVIAAMAMLIVEYSYRPKKESEE